MTGWRRGTDEVGLGARGVCVRVALTALLLVSCGLSVGVGGASAAISTRAYVANADSDSVSVIDTTTNTVIATIAVGDAPLAVAVNPAGTRAYVVNGSGSGSVSVIDTATNTVIATIAVGKSPMGVAINPAGTRAYVTNQNSDSVSVIDTTTNSVIATIAVGAGPTGVAVNPAGTRAYVTNVDANTVSVIDTTTNTVLTTIATGGDPIGVAVNPAGTRTYIVKFLSGTVSVIDTTTNAVLTTIAVGTSPRGVAVTPDGTHAYVTNQNSGSVSVIDTTTNTVIATIASSFPVGVAVNPAGTRAYVTNRLSDVVSVIDTATNTVLGSPIAVGDNPLAVAVADVPLAPAAPVLTDSDPDSPANDNSPHVKGTAEAGSTVTLFDNPTCSAPSVVSGTAATFASPGLAVSVADNSSTTFYATATDPEGTSPCSASGLTYVEDSAPPAPPVVTDTDPDSPANDNTPEVKGTAEAQSTVRLFTNATCTGSSVAAGSQASFASAGFTVGVPDDSSTTFYANATDTAGNESPCSSGLTYVEDSTPPDTIIDSGPADGSTTTATTATFTFHATQTGSAFACKLDTGPVQACDAGTKSYTDLSGGSHTFSVVATDPAGNADPSAATRTWTINTPPVATDDAYGVIGGATLTIPAPGVLGNDTDADHDPLTAQLATSTTKGTLNLNPDGSLTYTPGEDATGTDTFTYRASDGLAASNLATVTITITPGCDGVPATRVGTTGSDTLSGTNGNDVIVALGGNDTIDAGSGNDLVCGASGNDTIDLGSGNDRAFGGTGNDTLRGGSGDDTLHGDDGDDTLDGGGDRDALFGDAGADRLFGGGDPDTLDGGPGTPDLCDGQGGDDTATATCEQRNDI
jgi:YVTN family beta-propeller protein